MTLLRIHNYEANALERATNSAITASNELLDYCKSNDLDVPFEWVKKVITSGEMREEYVEELLSGMYKNQPKTLRAQILNEIREKLYEFPLFYLDRNFDFVEYKKGRAVMRDGALDEIRERFSVYINGEAESRYNRLKNALDEVNKVYAEIKGSNPFIHSVGEIFNTGEGGILKPSELISYNKK